MRKSLCTFALASMLLASQVVAQDQEGAKPANVVKPAEAILELVSDGKLEEAQKAFESADLTVADAAQVRRQLLNGFLRKGNYSAVYEIAKQDFLANYEENPTLAISSLSMASVYAPRANQSQDVTELVDMALTHFAEQAKSDGNSRAADHEMTVASVKARLLISQGKKDEAAELNASYLAKAKQALEENPSSSQAATTFATALMNSAQSAPNVEPRDAFFSEATDMLKSWMEKDEVETSIAAMYGSAMFSRINLSYRDDPNAAEAMLEQTRNDLKAAAEKNQQVEQIAAQYNTMLSRIASSIASAKKLAELVGSPAPAIDAKYWVNGKDMSVDSLDGKVVLLDFWAVWCGPCIATFPHLKEWNEDFGPKGLQIVGVTRKYNYGWNEQTNRATRAEGENTDEEEIAMLEKFLAHYELQHPTIITPDDSTMQTEYGVSGIPHAVLIDKKGIIRMVKVGSGEANANAIHDKIVELLAE